MVEHFVTLLKAQARMSQDIPAALAYFWHSANRRGFRCPPRASRETPVFKEKLQWMVQSQMSNQLPGLVG